MNQIHSLLQSVEQARAAFLAETANLSLQQAQFKPSPEFWSITDITEHIVRAEQIGLAGMWKAILGKKNAQPIWEGDNPNLGLSIEEVVKQTWQEKEQVPEVARPVWGGALGFWRASLESCSLVLQQLMEELGEMSPEEIVYPHPISGPLNVIQRLEFLRFHLERHQAQIQRVKAHPDYPG